MTALKFSMLSMLSILFLGNLVNARDPTTCSNPSSSSLTTCSVGFSTCDKCIGQTDCCGVVGNIDYGVCKDSNAHDCPNGSRFICNGGNCPNGIVCNYVNPLCPDPRHCWGTISCVGSCPVGYYNGMFCHEDGASNNFKVCCSYGGAIDCQVSSWRTWSACDPTTGLKTQTRIVTQRPQNGGAECPYLSQTAPCDNIDCQVSVWGDWSECDPITGLKTHTRTITQQAQNGGAACPYLSETIACDSVDCQVSAWGAWGSCNPVTGLKTHTRTITQVPLYGGTACPYLSETITCDPVNCQVSVWGPFGTCVNGLQTQTRTVIQQSLYGGNACPHLNQSAPCLPPSTGCGADLLVYKCTLSNSNGVGTTNCPSPGGELVVVVPNKKGWRFANVRVNGKAVSYTQS